ncbi:MAG TPA: M23 family metallopeptidase [bacterium]|nr:M23 family metallopeptidase [bacterium]HPN42780.1 M23 family metallopeptidase [bacterium]
MLKSIFIRKAIFLFIISLIITVRPSKSQEVLQWYLPRDAQNRQSWDAVKLTAIGEYGLVRKARPTVPSHLHTGIDFKRPGTNYVDEPVYPAAIGKVISLRSDGPFAQIIIEHQVDTDTKLWTVYEHVAGICVQYGQYVYPENPIARYMTKEELDKYGWQFDHFHFEVMKIPPRQAKPDQLKPFRYFDTYCLVCYTDKDLEKHYYHPQEFLLTQWRQTSAAQPGAGE